VICDVDLTCCTDRNRARLGLAHCGTVRVVAPGQAVGAGTVSTPRLVFLHLSGGVQHLYSPDSLFRTTPHTRQYIPLEGVVKRVPNYAYQLYFANPESTKEIEANVRNVIF
jgi:hypothetical protein